MICVTYLKSYGWKNLINLNLITFYLIIVIFIKLSTGM